MLIRSVFLGLVLASLVLAIPTRIEENNRNEINAKVTDNEESRRELTENNNKDEERRRAIEKADEERKNIRRGVETLDENKEENRRATLERDEEKKEERRRGVDKKEEEEKEERRRELNKKEEERRRGTETLKEEQKKEERRELNKKEEEEKKEERRGVDKKEEEEKEERRRELNKKEEEKKENRRRGTETLKEEQKKEERRETEEKKNERRGVDKKQEEEEKEERRRELNKKEEKKEERRGLDKAEEEKREERRELNRKQEEEKEERRRGVDKEEEKKEKRRAKEQNEREKRRPTPAIKEERRNIDRDEAKKVEVTRELKNMKLPISKRETVKEEPSLSICESVTDFKYYQKYESDPSKYIQCDPWGTGHIKTCPEGLLWNEWTLKCDAKEHIHNMTLDLSKFSISTAQRPVVNCSLVGMECLNGGSCVQAVSGSYKCACRTDYTGQYCESRVDLTDITHEILNSTFSVVDYRRRLQAENVTLGIHYYEKYKDQLDNETYTQLINYLRLYPNGEVRYDTLVNSLVEDILENIYPDAGYLSAFNASEQNLITMVQMVPSLLSYSRYSFERYEDVFAQYQHVLTTLVKLLNTTIPTVQEEATQYTILTHIFLNQTLALLNNTVDKSLFTENSKVEKPIQLTEADIKKALQVNYNATLKATEQLIQILETFQTSVVKELETNPSSVVNATLGQATFAGAKETLAVLNEVSVASTQIWESLINYGFWYLTNLFSSSSSSKIDSLQRFSFNLNKF